MIVKNIPGLRLPGLILYVVVAMVLGAQGDWYTIKWLTACIVSTWLLWILAAAFLIWLDGFAVKHGKSKQP